jgi:hypothetical protein
MSKSRFTFFLCAGLGGIFILVIIVLKLFGILLWPWLAILSTDWILLTVSIVVPIMVVVALKITDMIKPYV